MEIRARNATGESWHTARDAFGHLVVRIEAVDATAHIMRVTRDREPAGATDVEFIANARRDLTRLVSGVRGVATVTGEELEEIQLRCDAASPGPWIAALESDGGSTGCNVILVSHDDDQPDLYLWRGGDWTSWSDLAADADYEFVAQARQDIPELIAALRASGV